LAVYYHPVCDHRLASMDIIVALLILNTPCNWISAAVQFEIIGH